jgi:hypothetical protein
MAVSNDDSDRVSVAVDAASAAPAKISAVATAATPVGTRLATSAEHVSTYSGQKLSKNAQTCFEKDPQLRELHSLHGT